MAAHLRHKFRCGTAHRHRAQNTPGAVQTRVEAGERRGQYHHVHNVANVGHAKLRKEGDKRALSRLVGVPRQQKHQQHDGADIEQTDTPDNAVDRFWHHGLWIFTFTRRRTDQLDGGKGEDHALNQHQRR